MSMSMHCEAVKPADDDYKRKAEAWRACKAARIEIPQSLIDFFDGDVPDDTGMTVSLSGYRRSEHESCEPWTDDSCEGFQVDITKLPEGTRYVRFYCSW